jgi:hypothetical protein
MNGILFAFPQNKSNQMKATKIIAGIGLVFTAALVVYTVSRRKRINRMRMREETARRVSEHGYETAYDVLFPMKTKRKGIIQNI